ncbi:Hypothetical protein CINCED_3A008650 [Cinara cedri]|uniref:Uncharacterized protein n=1 Tax=Cinara cedri TaxID=506608 RepID=A0A5E4N679_9HEMI|nr:Hypothetical protein CINCED_3A008650 [Cinara cedri]
MKPKPRNQSPASVSGANDGSMRAMPDTGNVLLEMMRHVFELLTGPIVADFMSSLETVAARRQRSRFLDFLLAIAHKTHILLSNHDPEVRNAAELLTDVTAHLIVRLYY